MKIIGMLPTKNDEDIIQEVVEYLLSQNIELVILDNGSTDNTYKICEKYQNRGILKLKQYKTESYIQHWDLLLRMLYDMALVHSPDWVIRSDSDEFLESGIKNKTLKQSIEDADKDGYNLIQFDRFDFFMTNDDNEDAKSVREKMPYYSCHGDCLYRAWKVSPGIRIGTAGGHWPIFPEDLKYKILPRKFVMRHYTFRSKEQAYKKMEDRKRGTTFEQNKAGVNTHIKNILKQDYSRKFDHKLLTKYNEDDNWNYEIIFRPYMDTIPPKRKEIFTEEGKLKIKQRNLWDYHMELQSAQIKLNELRTLRGFLKVAKKAFFKKKKSKDL